MWLFSSSFVLLLTFCFHQSLQDGIAGETDIVCADNQFKCKNSSKPCMPMLWICDGDPDCDDASDEANCQDASCPAGEFKCANGQCIEDRFTCDKSRDCSDGSDEANDLCANKSCSQDQFQCANGRCIPQVWMCDGTDDCEDMSDETCDHPTCASDELRCDNGNCITLKWLCDGDNDCGDNSDEKQNCTKEVTCGSDEFRCDDGHCISRQWYCDGDSDCNDSSDEKSCSKTNSTSDWTCTAQEFLCSGSDHMCIHKSWVCDGDNDCPNEEDEQNCHTTCRSDQFRCKNNNCIYHTLKCDGSIDCVDGSDEMDCPSKASTCGSDEFACGDDAGKCIDVRFLCDGSRECGNDNDESSELCETSNTTEKSEVTVDNPCQHNNGGCEHTCIPLYYNKHRCSCHDGYLLVGNSTCEDIDECADHFRCSQLCVNLKGSYKCTCMDGYYMENADIDNPYCKVIGQRPLLIFADRHDVRTFNTSTRELKAVVEELNSAISVDFDYKQKMVYWSDVSKEEILRAKINESGGVSSAVEPVISTDIKTPDGIAVDWIYGLLYWTDTGYNRIEVAKQDGSMRKTLISTDLDEPRAIVVDPKHGWFFFSDWGSKPKIERCGMNGDPTSRKAIISKALGNEIQWPNGLTIDYVDDRIYWIDAKLHSITSSNYDGSDVRHVVRNAAEIRHPFSLAVFEESVYWTDWSSNAIRTVNKYSGEGYGQLALGLSSPMDINVYHERIQYTAENFCGKFNGGCSHLCLPNPQGSDKKYTCACPNGWVLNSNRLSCREEEPKPMTTTHNPPVSNKTESPNNTQKNHTAHTGTTEIPVVTTQKQPNVTTQKQNPVTTPKPSTASHPTYHVITTASPSQNETVVIKQEGPVGIVAIVVIAVVFVIAVLIAAIGCFVYRKYMKRNIKSMNFDNPVYRKTTEDSLKISLNSNRDSSPRDSALEPLNTDPLEV